MLLAQSCETLLLGNGVDIRADDERNEVEERNPGALGKELLRKGQADGRGDPAHTHHLPKADLEGGAYLMERPRASDERHGDQVH